MCFQNYIFSHHELCPCVTMLVKFLRSEDASSYVKPRETGSRFADFDASRGSLITKIETAAFERS